MEDTESARDADDEAPDGDDELVLEEDEENEAADSAEGGPNKPESPRQDVGH
jgi:hypothetical protein